MSKEILLKFIYSNRIHVSKGRVIRRIFIRNALRIIQDKIGLNWPSDVKGDFVKVYRQCQ